MLLDVNSAQGGTETEQERSAKIQRRSAILERVVFSTRNTFLGGNDDSAPKKFQLAIRRQLPSDFLEMKTLFGIRFDRVTIEKNKLIIELAGLFEAVFSLDLDQAVFIKPNIEPILNLYDYKMLHEELHDQYHIHGLEFKSVDKKGPGESSKT